MSTRAQSPPVLAIELQTGDDLFPILNIQEEIRVTVFGLRTLYSLTGIVYLGHAHFTCRSVLPDHSVWYSDGIEYGEQMIREGYYTDIQAQIAVAGLRKACLVIYKRVE